MTSLAALARTTPAAPPFNANFYIVAATIIPVLFLAIVVQGGSYEGLMKVLVALGRAVDRDEWYKSGPAAAAYPLVLVVGGLILAFGVISQIFAVYALYQQQAFSFTGPVVLGGVILLIIATATAPALTLVRTWFRTLSTTDQIARQHPGGTS